MPNETDIDSTSVKTPKEKRKSNKYRIILTILSSLLALIVVALVAGFLVFRHYYNMMDIVDEESQITLDSSAMSEIESEMADRREGGQESIDSGIEDEIEAARRSIMEEYGDEQGENGDNTGGAAAPAVTSNVFNILLIGVDRRDASWTGNSDAMILLSINVSKGTVTMTSFMRDTYANIPGVGYTKMNNSCAVGGAALVCQTLENNFLIHPDCYAVCDFNGLSGMVDAVGGIDLTLNPGEAKFIGLSIGETQVLHLNGKQALKHARDRFSSGSDYARTQRQRNVLMAIYNKVKSGGLGSFSDAASALLPYISTNMDPTTLANLVAGAATYLSYPITQLRVPFDGLYYNQNEYLIPDYQATINRLYSVIY